MTKARPSVYFLLSLLIIAYVALATYYSYGRWSDFHCLMIDYGNIDSAQYNTAHGKFMFSIYRGMSFWTDHFSPIMLVPALYYLFDDSHLFIFVWQSLMVGLTAVPLFFIARDVLKSQWAALIVASAYLANGRIQMANWFDYHSMCHEGLFILSAVLALRAKKFGWYIFFCVALLCVREDAFVSVIGLALYAGLAMREFKWAGVTAVLALTYGAVTFEVIHPYLRLVNGRKAPGYESYYAWIGQTPLDIVNAVFTHPAQLVQTLLNRHELVESWLSYSIAHGFLPFVSLSGMAIAFAPSSIFLLASKWGIYSLHYHYPLKIEAVWMLASVMGVGFIVNNVERLTKSARVAAFTLFTLTGYLLAANLYLSVDYGFPSLMSMRNEFPQELREHYRKVDEIIAMVPKNVSVTANQQTLTHFSHHKNAVMIDVSLFGRDNRDKLDSKNIDYIALDTRNDLDGDLTWAAKDLLGNSSYGLVVENDGAYLFRKGFPFKYSFARSPVYSPQGYTVPPENTHHLVGVKTGAPDGDGTIIVATVGKTQAGYIAFGSYVDLPRGGYTAEFLLKSDGPVSGFPASVDVVCRLGREVLASRDVSAGELAGKEGWRRITLPFRVSKNSARQCEARVYYAGEGQLIYGGKTIRYTSRVE